MKHASDRTTGFRTPRPASLDAVLARLEALSLKSEFALQRELALGQALRPYLEAGTGRLLPPLEQESELASLCLFCDFYPEDGQLTLIEQLRDVITEHIPNEERQWLDPLKHSYIDLLELVDRAAADRTLTLRSIGDGATCVVPGDDFPKNLVTGHVLLTRVLRDPGDPESRTGILAGSALLLSPDGAGTLYENTREWERNIEMASGSLALGDWHEFAKRYGHILLWNFAELRFAALVDAVAHIRYRMPGGEPYLYAIALYDHHEYRVFVDRLSQMSEFSEDPPPTADHGPVASTRLSPARRWTCREDGSAVARLMLTSSQLIVECDRPERLDAVKHQLAAVFGFSLHFRGETLTPPARQLSVPELTSDQPLTMVVTPEEDRALLKQFLEKAYLEWTDQPHRLLGGQTPRHAAASQDSRESVRGLIDEMERHDPGRKRLGKPAFDYNILRAHVGLDEVSS